MRRSLIVAMIFAVAVVAAATSGGGADSPEPARPEVKLRVSTHSGPRPLVLTLTGDITGASLADYEACYINVEWTYKTPAGSALNSKEDLPCVEPGTETRVPENFEKVLTLKEPGTYLYRIALQPRGGRRQAFTTQEVTVYRGPLEIEATATGVR